jgi:hypothetical protein
MATEAPATTPVLDDETLYRSVRDDRLNFVCDGQGSLTRLSTTAFNDRGKEPSVDRATLRPSGPPSSRRSESDGVVSLVTLDVRAIRAVVTYDNKGKVVQSHDVDVHHAPEDDNYSHALVKTAPHAAADNTFKRLKEALCRLAEARGWAFPPSSWRV